MAPSPSRAQAILVGALLGDALGAPFNGLRKGHVQQLAGGRVEGFLDNPVIFPDKPERNHLPGLHSSLGQRLLCSLAADLPDDLERSPGARSCSLLLELAGGAEGESQQAGALRQPGRPLRRAIAHWREEFPWEEEDWFTKDGSSEGLSVCALGLAGIASSGAVSVDDVLRQVRPTHLRFLPLAGSLAVARCAELILQRSPGKRIDGVALARELVRQVKSDETALVERFGEQWQALDWGLPALGLSEALASLPSMVQEANDDLAASTVVRGAAAFSPVGDVTHAQHGFVATSLPWAFYRVLTAESFPRAMEEVQNSGGETCAVGAIVGGLLVARFGLEGVPEEWLEELRCRPLANALLAGGDAGLRDRILFDEGRWSAEEESLRAPLREKLSRAERDLAAKHPAPAKKREEAEVIELPFAPPPHLLLKPGDEEDPRNKRKLKEARGRRRIDWKEERRDRHRGKGEGADE